MKTYNLQYSGIDELLKFINEKRLDEPTELLIQIFSGVLDEEELTSLRDFLLDALPKATIIGTTTDGEIHDTEVSTETIIISFSVFEQSTLTLAYVEDLQGTNSFAKGKELASKLLSDQTKVIIAFSDGLHTNGEEFVKGANSVMPQHVILSGGLSGDNALMRATTLLSNRCVGSNCAVGVAIDSEVLQAHLNYAFAWEEIGRSFVVEKSDANVVHQISGMSAVELYRRYLGDEVASLLPGIGIEFPLIMYNNGVKVGRAILGKNDDGSLVFAGNVNEGSIVRFGVGSADNIIKDAKKLLRDDKIISAETIFVYSCMARRRFLENHACLDVERFAKVCPVSGFFTYGEFYRDELLNETMTLLSLSEESEQNPNTLNFPIEEEQLDMTTVKAISKLVDSTTKELNDKTEELLILNKELNERVASEVEKSKEKDRQMLAQSRLAQMGEMLNMIAHQWRQPLSAISNTTSSLLLKNMMGGYEVKEFETNLNNILKYSQHLSSTINDFRNFFKSEKSKYETTLHQLIDDVTKIISPSIDAHNIHLEVQSDSNTSFKSFPNEIKQVILNLIKNSEDVLNEKQVKRPSIKMQSDEDAQFVYLHVEDNGGGIDEDVSDKVFEPYFTSKKQDGTGLGLYMSKIIIESHCEGEIFFNNTSEGVKFTIKIPK